ncbi:hypothetical protein Tco_1107558 [Tanacetum coccineum]
MAQCAGILFCALSAGDNPESVFALEKAISLNDVLLKAHAIKACEEEGVKGKQYYVVLVQAHIPRSDGLPLA